jgi:subtilisin-like proprotein convertase family protein
VTLVEANENSANFQGSIALVGVDGSGQLFVTGGDTITVTYVDPDDGEGGINVPVTDQAIVDCTAPEITNVQASGITGSRATITWETDEPADSLVDYGIGLPILTTGVDGLVTDHLVELTWLDECTLYSYSVTSADEVGNAATEDNGGVYFAFETGRNVNPTYPSEVPPVAIPDNSSAGAEMSIVVPDDKPVVDVNVQVFITHTYDGDLELSLIGPEGTEVTLSNRNGGSGNDFNGTIFDDEADMPIGSGSAPFEGSFRPDGLLSTFDGGIAAGEWRLRVEDHAGADTGNIESWNLMLTYTAEACGPSLEAESYVMSDTCAGFGSGSGNGRIEPAEDAVFDVTMHNDGSEATTGITAYLSTTTPGVTISNHYAEYPDLARGESAESLSAPFTFTVDNSVECGSTVEFTVDAAANEGGWTSHLSMIVGDSPFGPTCAPCSVALPDVVASLEWTGANGLQWSAASGASFYSLFRGELIDLPDLMDGTTDSCRRLTTAVQATGDVLTEEPAANASFWYLVCAGNGGGEGPVGDATDGPRIVDADVACP